MAKIKKKIKTNFYSEIISGKKNFELFLNDLNLQEGDILILQEYDASNNITGRELEKKIKFVQKINIENLPWPPDDIANEGLQIVSFE